jgi:hypothetical protein
MSWGNSAIGVFQRTGQAWLDADEVDRMITSIDAMMKLIDGPVPQSYTEVELLTKTGLKLTLFPVKDVWNIFVERHGHRQYIDPDDLAKILTSLKTAKAKL